MLLGPDGLERLRQARVAVCGLGAVGSYAVEALARAGVGALRIVDFDEVCMSNINRQLYALQSTLGRKKVELAAQRIADINPDCQIEALDLFIDIDTIGNILQPPLDFLVDAIDGLNSKVELIASTIAAKVPLITSMGAATRTDPSAIRIGDLFEVTNCPLARKVRKRLRKRHIESGVTCVYSLEQSSEHTGDYNLEPDADPLARGRPRLPLGSLSYITGIFGLMIASHVIRDIGLK
jgi:tRNA A37 threonylcarbamoyladenosine dehydratase